MSYSEVVWKLWQYPPLRKQIPKLIETERKKYFALQAATERQYQKWQEIEREYERLYNGLGDRKV